GRSSRQRHPAAAGAGAGAAQETQRGVFVSLGRRSAGRPRTLTAQGPARPKRTLAWRLLSAQPPVADSPGRRVRRVVELYGGALTASTADRAAHGRLRDSRHRAPRTPSED